MFNTAKNTIKKAAKDQVEFFLILLTGLFAGSIFTLAYVKFWEKGDATFADIGGMLAGVGTIGLLLVAVKTASSWREQFSTQYRKDTVDDYFKAHDHLMSSIIKISAEKKAIDHTENKLEKDAAENILRLEATIRQFKFATRKLNNLYNQENQHASITTDLAINLGRNLEDNMKIDSNDVSTFNSTVDKINEINKIETKLIDSLTDFINSAK